MITRVLPGLAGAAVLVLLASCQTMSTSNPSVMAFDQRSDNDTVLVERVVSPGPGWLVIHADNHGTPGPDLGWAALKPGVNWNVRVRIDPAKATQYLWAMLHSDLGVVGKYEYPGPDVPVVIAGKVVMKEFERSAGYTGAGGMAGGY